MSEARPFLLLNIFYFLKDRKMGDFFWGGELVVRLDELEEEEELQDLVDSIERDVQEPPHKFKRFNYEDPREPTCVTKMFKSDDGFDSSSIGDSFSERISLIKEWNNLIERGLEMGIEFAFVSPCTLRLLEEKISIHTIHLIDACQIWQQNIQQNYDSF